MRRNHLLLPRVGLWNHVSVWISLGEVVGQDGQPVWKRSNTIESSALTRANHHKSIHPGTGFPRSHK